MPRELILLSPYTPPTQHALMLGAEDTACWLNAWSALWHPAALAGANGPPRWSSAYDHETPSEGYLYSLPESPPLYLSDDWNERVRQAGAAAFHARLDRLATLANLREALGQFGADLAPFDWPADRVRQFFGLGLAYAVIETLFEAMEHERLLDRDAFWADVQEAIRNPEAVTDHLRSAAEKLHAAREGVYPVAIHLLDFALLEPEQSVVSVPAAFERRSPVNLIATADALQAMSRKQPKLLSSIRERMENGGDEPTLEICGGPMFDREDELLPVESQLWNLRRGLEVTKQLTGADVQVFASPRGSFHPQSPLILHQLGITRALFFALGDARLPAHKSATIQWPASDGRQIEAFTRAPLPADDPQTFFHLGHYLHQTIMQDTAATLALLHHPDKPAAEWYEDWLALSALSPVIGTWTTMSRYLRDCTVGEYASPANADEFAIDALEMRVKASGLPHPPTPSPTRGEGEKQPTAETGCAPPSPIVGEGKPVSAFARHLRLRRRLDGARTYAALHRGLGGGYDGELHDQLAGVEEKIERFEAVTGADLEKLERRAAAPLVERLLSRAADRKPGLLLLNPCAFARRVTLERDDFQAAPPLGGPVKAVQRDGEMTRMVVEVPALGFAWISRTGESAEPARSVTGGQKPRVTKLADTKALRNEFFEADIDPATGGLRAIRDVRTRENRLGQQLVYQPGNKTIVKEITVTSAGPALGEVVSTGALVDEHDAVLATFRQRFRAWLGRPLVEMRIELFPEHQPQGYPWHAYYGARFAWRDERATVVRGVVGQSSVTTHTRPTTPDYLELRSGPLRTLILPGGLPFHQRHGTRMLDVILVPEGESAQKFDLALGLDREQPMQTAWGLTSPLLAIPVEKGPPHIGPTGWLFHLDAPNLLMTSLTAEPAEAAAVVARMLELSGFTGAAELRVSRDPKDASLVDALGTLQQTLYPQGDAVPFDYASGDLVSVRVEF